MVKHSFVLMLLAMALISGCVSNPTTANVDIETSDPLFEKDDGCISGLEKCSDRDSTGSDMETRIACIDYYPAVVPGDSLEKVEALWGKPDYSSAQVWEYSFVKPIGRVTIFIKDGNVFQIQVPGSECLIREIVSTLGPPTTVEVFSDKGNDSPVYPTRWLYYVEQGITFITPCQDGNTLERCSFFQETDYVEEIIYYAPASVEEVRSFHRDYGTDFIEWPGFKDSNTP